MATIKFKNSKGDWCRITHLPQSVSDITFEQFCEMQEDEKLFFKKLNADEDGFEQHMIDFVGRVIKGDIRQVDYAVQDDEDKIKGEVSLWDNLTDYFSIIRLYKYMTSLIGTYKTLTDASKAYKVKFADEWFYFTPRSAENYFNALDDNYNANRLTVGEVMEVNEIRAHRKAFKKQNQSNEPAFQESESNMNFGFTIREMAVLLRKKGEELPVDKADREAFILSRMKLFKNLPLNIVFDVRFFLTSSLQILITTHLMKPISLAKGWTYTATAKKKGKPFENLYRLVKKKVRELRR